MGEEVEKLVERLRGAVTASGGIDLRDPVLLTEAAATLERVERERDEALLKYGNERDSHDVTEALQKAAEAQVEALKRKIKVAHVLCCGTAPKQAVGEVLAAALSASERRAAALSDLAAQDADLVWPTVKAEESSEQVECWACRDTGAEGCGICNERGYDPAPESAVYLDWRPIETAPANTHHMRQIIVYWRSRGAQQTYWDVDEEFAVRPKRWRSPASGWRCDGDQCIPVNQEDCTHWMPLPAAPAEARGDQPEPEAMPSHLATEAKIQRRGRYDEAKRAVIDGQKASVGFIQRELQIGFNEATHYIERMQAEGVVSPPIYDEAAPYNAPIRKVLPSDDVGGLPTHEGRMNTATDAPLRPGQRRLLSLFKGQDDIIFASSDPFDMRVCCALKERGLMQWFDDGQVAGYELTDAGRAALEQGS